VGFDVGDWIVHAYYGVGQIEGVEERPVQGEDTDCFKVQTRDAEYWVPVERVENPRIRPVASRNRMQRAIRAIKKTPEEMNTNYRTRQARISEVLGSGSLLEMARLLRDLRGRQIARKLNATEMGALDDLKERMTHEWSVAMKIKFDTALQRLDEVLLEVPELA
jgi:RNA polymerase-interacting CarD/CdnL/TRCF family regulator